MENDELNKRILLVIDSDRDFSSISDLVDLDPETDFRNMDLSGIDFGNSDLRDFRFYGSTIDHSDLTRCTMSPNTLLGVSSKKGAKLPQIVEDWREGYSLTVTIPKEIHQYMRSNFGSIRRAIIETLSAGTELNFTDLRSLVEEYVVKGRGEYGPDDRKSSVKIPLFYYNFLHDIADEFSAPLTATMRIMLMISSDALYAYEDNENEFLKEFRVRLDRVRSGHPTQGYLL